MTLESCMILLDDSQYMRNGDYIPTRHEAQRDAANLIVGAKTQSNVQTTIGICYSTIVQLSPTTKIADILTAIHESRIQKDHLALDICTAVSVASLALKHRPNKTGAQRIVAFVGTPITCDDKSLIKTGKMLKKNNVQMDVVVFGEHETNPSKLQLLVDHAAGGTLVVIPTGVLASDVLVSSPILADAQGTSSVAALQAAEFGGVDPNMDPELAMALRVSMEEERARQERAAILAANANTASTDDANAGLNHTAMPTGMLSEEEMMLQQALAMSMNENEPTTSMDHNHTNNDPEAKSAEEEEAAEEDAIMADDEMDEDAAMQMALQMSLQNNEGEFHDPAFVQGMLDEMKDDMDDDDDDNDDNKPTEGNNDGDNKE